MAAARDRASGPAGRSPIVAILAKLAEIVDAGALVPLLDETQFRLDEVGQAHDRLTGGEAIGKVVVEI